MPRVLSLDAATGRQIWKSYTIADPAKPTKKNANGVQQYGPAGAAIWSSPTVDVARIRRVLDENGLELRKTDGEGTLFCWAWAVKRG